MARISGNVNASGSIQSNTSNTGGFSVTAQPNGNAPGTYRVTFDTPFSETPTVVANPINTEPMMGAILVGIVPTKSYVDLKFVYNGQYAAYSFSFAAWGAQ